MTFLYQGYNDAWLNGWWTCLFCTVQLVGNNVLFAICKAAVVRVHACLLCIYIYIYIYMYVYMLCYNVICVRTGGWGEVVFIMIECM